MEQTSPLQQITQLQNYPMNLLLSIRNRPQMELPIRISADIEAGLQYVLSTLNTQERAVLQLRYQAHKDHAQAAADLNIQTELVVKLEKDALRKLRQPSKWNYIRFGCAGLLKKCITEQYNKGYHTGYRERYQKGLAAHSNEDAPKQEHSELWILPVKSLGLSTRVVNSLCRWNDISVADLIQFREEDIIRIKNMGAIGADEVARKLDSLGFPNTEWSKFLL